MRVGIASLLAACIALGRFGAGAVMARFDWYPVLNACLAVLAALIILVLPLAARKGGKPVQRARQPAANLGRAIPIVPMRGRHRRRHQQRLEVEDHVVHGIALGEIVGAAVIAHVLSHVADEGGTRSVDPAGSLLNT